MKKENVFLLEPSVNPPNGLEIEETPMFVLFGYDDNAYSGLNFKEKQGLSFMTELYSKSNNPSGKRNPLTFDGISPHFSFYVTTKNIEGEYQKDSTHLVKKAWREAVDAGHEIGNHTYSHPHGRDNNFTVQNWMDEMVKCEEMLAKHYEPENSESGLGLAKNKIIGFRTPYCGHNQTTVPSVVKMGYVYDASLLAGMEEMFDGTNYYWPYHIPQNVPFTDNMMEAISKANDLEFSSVLEIPLYYLISPPDSLCSKYGIEPGFRQRISGVNECDGDHIKIPGSDWNIFIDYGLSKEEALAVVKYTLDLRLQSNRCPISIAMHPDMYVDMESNSKNEKIKTNAKDRRDFHKQLLEYLVTKQEVRIVSHHELYNWLRNPVSL